jgi:hypothetical protein
LKTTPTNHERTGLLKTTSHPPLVSLPPLNLKEEEKLKKHTKTSGDGTTKFFEGFQPVYPILVVFRRPVLSVSRGVRLNYRLLSLLEISHDNPEVVTTVDLSCIPAL